jgi:DNA-directed RNA polymerase subunit RPC12/RpoP
MNTKKINWTNVEEAKELNRALTKEQKLMFKEKCKNGHIGQPIYKCPDCAKTFCNACSNSWETDKEALISCPNCGKTTTI